MSDFAVTGWWGEDLPLSPAGDESPGRLLYDASCYDGRGEVVHAIAGHGKLQLHRKAGAGHICFWIGSKYSEDGDGLVGRYVQDDPHSYNEKCARRVLSIIPLTQEVATSDRLERRLAIASSMCQVCPDGLFRRMKSRYVVDCATQRCGACGGVSINHDCPRGHWASPMHRNGLFRIDDINPRTPPEVVASLLLSEEFNWSEWKPSPGWQHWPNIQQAYRDAISPGLQEEGSGRGIVTCAGGKYFVSGYASIRAIRHLGCKLPIELWLLPNEVMERWHEAAIADLDVTVHKPREKVEGGWQLKYHAILHSQFREVLFFDADCYPVVDPGVAFEWPAYLATGCFLWLDRWKDNPNDGGPGSLLPPSTFKAMGITYSDELTKDSGVMLIDKSRHGDSLARADWMNRLHWRYYYRDAMSHGYVYGDKDLLWLAMRLLGESYATSPIPWGGTPIGGMHVDPSGRPFCFHNFSQKFILGSTESRAALFPMTWQRPDDGADFPMKREMLGFLDELREVYAAHPPRIHAVTICIDYEDYLAATIANKRFFNTWTIVTVAGDKSIDLAREHGLDVLLTDRLHHAGSAFNLGAMRAEAFQLLSEKFPCDWILSLDGDVILPNNFSEEIQRAALDRDRIYGASRRGDGSEAGDNPVSGFFQLFPASAVAGGKNYSSKHHNAGDTDIWFRDLWAEQNRVVLPLSLTHLGMAGMDWDGRVSAVAGNPIGLSSGDPWHPLLRRPLECPALIREPRWIEFFGRSLSPDAQAAFRERIAKHPPRLYSRDAYARWAWERHSELSKQRIGWRDACEEFGWPQRLIPLRAGAVRSIKVFGLQRTGTNLAAWLLRENFTASILDEADTGWKHGKLDAREWAVAAGFILCLRHPLIHLASFYRYCCREYGIDSTIHPQFKDGMSFRDFLITPCYEFASPAARVGEMYRHWLEALPEDRTLIVRQTDQVDQRWTVGVIARKFGLPEPETPAITAMHVDVNCSLSEKTTCSDLMDLYSPELLATTVKQIDFSFMSRFGYSAMNP